MDIYKLISFFRKEYKDKKLIEFLKKDGLDVVKEVQDYMETDEYEGAESSVYASNMQKGYDLVFEDELDYLDVEHGRYGESGNYYFVCVHFYAQDVDDYNQYKGELINGIKLTHTREEIRELMKEPFKINDITDAEIWNNINGCQVYVQYNNQNKPRIITISHYCSTK